MSWRVILVQRICVSLLQQVPIQMLYAQKLQDWDLKFWFMTQFHTDFIIILMNFYIDVKILLNKYLSQWCNYCES